MQKLKLLWVTDPWTTLDHLQDTTLRLATEAMNLGIESYWSGSDFILDASPSRIYAYPIEPNFIQKLNPLDLRTRVELDVSKFHHLHYRIDPPVDFNYISLLKKLKERGFTEAQILNPPTLISTQSEKVPPPQLQDLTPLLKVIQNPEDAMDAFKMFQGHRELVSKPLNLAQSIGVKKWPNPTQWNEFEIQVRQDTQDYQTPILLEEYLPGVMEGEVRMWFAGGEFIAALKKFPKSGDFRVLMDEGSRTSAYQLGSEEMLSAKKVGETLKSQGVALAAIDFISGKISDYNITSPGLLIQLEKLHGQNFAKEVLTRLYLDRSK